MGQKYHILSPSHDSWGAELGSPRFWETGMEPWGATAVIVVVGAKSGGRVYEKIGGSWRQVSVTEIHQGRGIARCIRPHERPEGTPRAVCGSNDSENDKHSRGGSETGPFPAELLFVCLPYLLLLRNANCYSIPLPYPQSHIKGVAQALCARRNPMQYTLPLSVVGSPASASLSLPRLLLALSRHR